MRVQQPLVDLPRSELVWISVKDGFQLVYKVTIAAQMPTGGFVQYLNAQDGRLAGSYSLSLPRNGKSEDRTPSPPASSCWDCPWSARPRRRPSHGSWTAPGTVFRGAGLWHQRHRLCV